MAAAESVATAASSASAASAEVFGPYEVYERLGVGGMATVHRARVRDAQGRYHEVALKRLLGHLAEDESFVRAFVREAKLASLLEHDNIVRIYELGRVGHNYFMSMEYVAGQDLRCVLRQARRLGHKPPLSVVLGLMRQLLQGLDYAHRSCDQQGQPLGIVHRDVSPSNLLVTQAGQLKIIDFGIAKAQTQQFLTHTGRIKGKLAYMAPEAAIGQAIDARCDLFSAGIIAHELLAVRPLFASKNEYDTLLKLQRGEIVPPSQHNPNCPPELDAVVLKALAREPRARYGSAREFGAALDAVAAARGLHASTHDVSAWCAWLFSEAAHVEGSNNANRAISAAQGAPAASVAHAGPGVSAGPAALTGQPVAEIFEAGEAAVETQLWQRAPDPVSFASGYATKALDAETVSLRGGTLRARGTEAPVRAGAGEDGGLRGTAPMAGLTEADTTLFHSAESDEIAEEIWARPNQAEAVPVLIDEVPDVSNKIPYEAFAPPVVSRRRTTAVHPDLVRGQGAGQTVPVRSIASTVLQGSGVVAVRPADRSRLWWLLVALALCAVAFALGYLGYLPALR